MRNTVTVSRTQSGLNVYMTEYTAELFGTRPVGFMAETLKEGGWVACVFSDPSCTYHVGTYKGGKKTKRLFMQKGAFSELPNFGPYEAEIISAETGILPKIYFRLPEKLPKPNTYVTRRFGRQPVARASGAPVLQRIDDLLKELNSALREPGLDDLQLKVVEELGKKRVVGLIERRLG